MEPTAFFVEADSARFACLAADHEGGQRANDLDIEMSLR